MDIRIIFWLVAVLSLSLFLAFSYSRVGITRSISKLYYELEKPYRYLYTIAMWMFAIPMSIAGDTPLMFWAAAALALTGTAADSRRNALTEYLHVGGAYLSIILGLFSIGYYYGHLWLAGIGTAGIFALLIPRVRNHTYWVEVIAAATISAGVLLDIIS